MSEEYLYDSPEIAPVVNAVCSLNDTILNLNFDENCLKNLREAFNSGVTRSFEWRQVFVDNMRPLLV